MIGKANAVDGARRVRARERSRAIPAPEANAEIQTNLDVCLIHCYFCFVSSNSASAYFDMLL